MQPRFLIGADFIDNDRRAQILSIISSTRDREQSIIQRLEGLPNWLQQPFGTDQAAFDEAMKQFQAQDATVRGIEARLMTQPGPTWKELSPQELGALQTWSDAADALDGLTSKYYPLESEKDWKKLVLLGVGIAAIFGPLFFSESEDGFKIPAFRPPTLPPSVTPSARRTVTTTMPASTPLPGGYAGYQRTDVMRPATSTFRVPSPASPFRAAPGGSPGFVRPPVAPPGAVSAPFAPAPPRGPIAPPAMTNAQGQARFSYPRFRNA